MTIDNENLGQLDPAITAALDSFGNELVGAIHVEAKHNEDGTLTMELDNSDAFKLLNDLNARLTALEARVNDLEAGELDPEEATRLITQTIQAAMPAMQKHISKTQLGSMANHRLTKVRR